jgi:anti-sigma-K factor RskA
VNTADYISSGIVESYVLGLTSPEESAEFERICSVHEEVRRARESFEKQLETALLEQKIAPPREVKASLFSRIGMEEIEPPPTREAIKPGAPLQERPALIPRAGVPRMVAAAAFILLLGSVLLNLYLLSQYKHTIALNQEAEAAQKKMTDTNRLLNTALQHYEAALQHMKDPQMEIVKLPSMPGSPAPSSMATVYWNTNSKEVYLLVNKLPMPATGMQYQLWAWVDGKPTDAGTFDMNEQGTHFMKLKTVPRAEAFAVTLEKKGGSETPDMNAVYVMGKVTG